MKCAHEQHELRRNPLKQRAGEVLVTLGILACRVRFVLIRAVCVAGIVLVSSVGPLLGGFLFYVLSQILVPVGSEGFAPLLAIMVVTPIANGTVLRLYLERIISARTTVVVAAFLLLLASSLVALVVLRAEIL